MPRALDPKIRARARQLCAHGKSLAEIKKALGISHGSAYRFTKGTRPERERSPEVRALIAAAKRPRHEEWKKTAPRGGCGAPGCSRADCPIPYGKCHCDCGRDAPLADVDDRTRNYVRGEPRLYVQGDQRGGNTLMATEGGEVLLGALERIGLTRIETSRRAKLGKGVVSELVGRKGYRLRRERCECIVRVLRDEFERQGLDASQVTLEQLFSEERPADEPPVGERARRPRHRDPIPPNERGDGRHFKANAEEAQRVAAAEGVWTQSQVCEELVLERPTVIYLEQHGRIPQGEVRAVGAVRIRVYDPREVKLAARALLRSEDPWDRRRRDREATLLWALGRGSAPVQARALADQVDRRLRAWGRFRPGTGRPKSEGIPEDRARRAVVFEWLMEEETNWYVRDVALELAPAKKPTRTHVARLVATEDYAHHPECWTYNPADLPREAEQRVLGDVKALQNSLTETRAA
jgi:hypothetical protein